MRLYAKCVKMASMICSIENGRPSLGWREFKLFTNRTQRVRFSLFEDARLERPIDDGDEVVFWLFDKTTHAVILAISSEDAGATRVELNALIDGYEDYPFNAGRVLLGGDALSDVVANRQVTGELLHKPSGGDWGVCGVGPVRIIALPGPPA